MNISKLYPVALAVAGLSKDPSTRVASLLVGPDGEAGPFGFNGAPRGCAADEDYRKDDRPLRLKHFEHAERNAIYAAARQGYATKGCFMVITHFPCMDCARAIVQAGIKKVFCPHPTADFMTRWGEDIKLASNLFDECGIEVQLLEVA